MDFLLALLVAVTLQDPGGRPAECGDWRECRQMALDAAAEREYERFHDLAWRAVQKGPPQDASLMYVLARAQSLSGRPHDALVMLLRLADRGVETDAAVNEDFEAVRRLPQWPELEARLATRGGLRGGEGEAPDPQPSIAAAAPGKGASTRRSSGPPADPVPGTEPVTRPAGASVTGGASHRTPAPSEVSARGHGAIDADGSSGSGAASLSSPEATLVEEALRVPALAMTPVALAHDRASGRFVFGDAPGRKLVIVDERRHLVVDLVREASAGFYDITAFEIDRRRGDLWVASADGDAGATALHHVQLVSGRPIRTVEPPDGARPARFIDVAVSREGVVYVLDAAGPRLFALAPGATALTVVAPLPVASPSSLAPAPGGVVYIAGADGVTRLNLQTGRAVSLTSAGAPLPAFARIRWHTGALVAIQPLPDGTSRILRIPLANARRAVVPRVLVSGALIPRPSAATIEGDALYFVSDGGSDRETVVKRYGLP